MGVSSYIYIAQAQLSLGVIKSEKMSKSIVNISGLSLHLRRKAWGVPTFSVTGYVSTLPAIILTIGVSSYINIDTRWKLVKLNRRQMIKLILFVLCSSLAPIHTTRCYIRNIYSDRIPEASKPTGWPRGEYSIDWAAAAIPEGAGVCVKQVIIFYKCQNKTHCLAHSKTKRPSRDKDVSPFILPICAGPGYHRQTAIYFEAFRSARLRK